MIVFYKINHLIHTLHNEQDKAKLQSYIDAKSPVELNKLVKIAIQKYQEKRSDYARKNLNNFLGYFHKKLESTAYSRALKMKSEQHGRILTDFLTFLV